MSFSVCLESLSNDRCVVRVSGELDLSTSPEFEAAIKKTLRARPKRLIADLSELTYINSHGMYGLLKAQFRLAREGGEVVIVGARPEIQTVLDLLGVPVRIRCVAGMTDALTSVSRASVSCQ